MSRYEGYRWIKVARHEYDAAKSWEENYRDLERHHIAETSFLIEEVRRLAKVQTEAITSPDRADGSIAD